jgi:hypothetical protein
MDKKPPHAGEKEEKIGCDTIIFSVLFSSLIVMQASLVWNQESFLPFSPFSLSST